MMNPAPTVSSQEAAGGVVAGFLRAKNAHDPQATHAYFHGDRCAFTDATLGMQFVGNTAVRTLWDQLLPPLPAGAHSRATRIVGGPSSSIVFVTNSPEMFGSEIRSVAAVDIEDDRVVRWVDYWDGRTMGAGRIDELRAPIGTFPTSFGEDLVVPRAQSAVDNAAHRLAEALSGGDSGAAASMMAPDAFLEDVTLRIALRGSAAIERFLDRALPDLPWGTGACPRHVRVKAVPEGSSGSATGQHRTGWSAPSLTNRAGSPD
jgi:ketosteroid isomerase-like protein